MAELICPMHGHYDASYGTCPVCSGQGNRPSPPTPLVEDDMPTDIDGGGFDGDWDDNFDPTEIGAGSGTEQFTEIGRGGRADETELYDDFGDEGMLALLWIKDGRRRGRTYSVKDGFDIGREDQDIILDDPKVSSHHAGFKLEDEGFEIWDYRSKNGTFVNGERIKAATLLKENDEIKIGDTTFVFKILE